MSSWRTFRLRTWLCKKVRVRPEEKYVCCSVVIHIYISDTGGLQLYLGPDGSVRFDQPSTLDTEYQPVVMEKK